MKCYCDNCNKSNNIIYTEIKGGYVYCSNTCKYMKKCSSCKEVVHESLCHIKTEKIYCENCYNRSSNHSKN